MSDIFVAIPWRDRGDDDRRNALRFIADHMVKTLGCPAHLVDGKQEAFSLAAARNEAVRQAQDAGAGIVVICDSDTMAEHSALVSAIHTARSEDRVVLPFNLFRALSYDASQKVMAGRNPMLMPDIGNLTWSVGGICVTTPKAWWALGGQDERFTGWGCEDIAFSLVADRMHRSHVRIKGVIHHLWHPASPDKGEANASYRVNAALLQRYDAATNIEDIIRER